MWEMVRLGDLVGKEGVFNDGDWIESKDQDQNGEVRLIQLADIGIGTFIDKSNRFMTKKKSEELKCHYLKKGDLLIARMPEPIGRCCEFPLEEENKYVTVVDVAILRVNRKDVNSKYVMHCLNSQEFYNKVFCFVTGTTRKRIARKKLEALTIPLPPLAIQEQIVTILDKADRLRQLDKAIEEKYDALAQSIFIDMFGDPVKNEKGWETEKLSIVAPFRRYEGLVEDFESRFWLLNLDMIRSNGGNVISKLFVEKEEIGNSTITFNQEQVLYSKLRPYLNKVVLPDSSGYATTELVPLNPKKEILNRVFLCYLLRSKSFVYNIEEKVAGAKMPRVNMDVLRKFVTILPPIELQNEFAKKTAIINQMKEQEMKGEELFQVLLQKAFKGELVS